MTSGDLGSVRDGDWERLQELIGRFEAAWFGGERPKIADYLPAEERYREAVMVELVHAELEFRIKAGEPARVEDYLRRHPALARDRATVLDLIRAEWTLRRRREAGLTLDRYRVRFPAFRDELEPEAPASATTVASPIRSASVAPAAEGPLPRALGKYELRQRVGAGAFGVVYRAWDGVLNREVAVKIPRPEAMAAPSDLRAFLREARNAIDLRHPNIVAILDAGPIAATACVVRAFVDGPTLAERLKESSITHEDAASMMALVADALHYAHGRGIIHRDLKPSNILLDRQGRPHVSDFGLAKRESGDTTLSPAGQVGTMIGTPAYMPPEQARGEAHLVDARSDVYSLGVILYELLTGSVPFRGRGRMLQIQIQSAEPAPPRSLNEDVPRDLETICLRALAKLPSARYASAQAMADDLKNYVKGRPVEPRPGAAPRRARGGSRPWPLVAAVALVAGSLGATVIWISLDAERSAQARSLREAVATLDRLASLPYAPGLDGPESHRRFLDEVQSRSIALLPAIAEGGDPDLRDAVGRSIARLAGRESSVGSDRVAAELWARAIRLAESPGDAAPGHPARDRELARALSGLAGARERLGEKEVAAALLRRADGLRDAIRDEARRRSRDRPGDVDALLDWAEAEVEVDAAGPRSACESNLAEAGRIASLASATPTAGQGARRRLARLDLAIALGELAAHEPSRARQAAAQGLRITEAAPGDQAAEVDHARLLLACSAADRELGRARDALEFARRASERLESLTLRDPLSVGIRRDLGASLFESGRILLDQPGRLDEAIEDLGRSLRVRRALRRSHPQSHEDLARLAETRAALGSAWLKKGEIPASVVAYAQAVASEVGAVALAPGVEAHRRDLAIDAGRLARLAWSAFGRFTIGGWQPP